MFEMQTLMLLAAIGLPAGGFATLALKRLGAVHAAELILKTGACHTPARNSKPN